MLRLLVFFLFLLKCSLVFSQKTILNTSLVDIKGNTTELQELTLPDKPTFISFWASWCKPCLEEIVALDHLLKTKQLDINYILINTDELRTLSKAKQIAKQKQWSAHLLFDTNQDYMRVLGVRNLPQSFLYDKNRILKASFNAFTKGDEYKYFDLLK
ncbi:MAG TPA: TlpA disulfide reductase family protein [Leadbetterella sp.]|nr:TlpA disulfide reductase family protein [Leadbetterella sp.]